MVGKKWKPIDNITKRQQRQSSAVKNPFPGRDPGLLSKGQHATVQKKNTLPPSQPKEQNMKQNHSQLSLNQHIKIEQDLFDTSNDPTIQNTSSTFNKLNSANLTGASGKFNKKNNKNYMTQNSNNNNNNNNDNNDDISHGGTTIIVKKENNQSKKISDNTHELKKKINKLQNKIKAYKQNEILFKKNTNIITEEILDNQFKISILYGQLKSSQLNNQKLNDLNDFLINDLISTKIDFQRIRNNFINHIKLNHFNTINDRTTTLSQQISENKNAGKDQNKQVLVHESPQNKADNNNNNNNSSNDDDDMVVTKSILQKLENNIMKRLNQYEDLQNSFENQIKQKDQSSNITDLTISDESPYIKKLKNTIKTYNEDLQNLHSVLYNRTARYQFLLDKSVRLFDAVEQKRQNDAINTKDYIDKSQNYMHNARLYIAQLEKEKNESLKLINDLKNSLTEQDKKWRNEVAQLKVKLENINNDNHKMNAINVSYETQIKKLTQELQLSKNLHATKQATIKLLNSELNNINTALTPANPHQNLKVPNSDTLNDIINNQKKSYESLLDLVRSEHKKEIDILKTQYSALEKLYQQATTKPPLQQLNRDSPAIQNLIMQERQRLLTDIKFYLDFTFNNPNMKDYIKTKDMSNAVYLLHMIASKIMNSSNNPQAQVQQRTMVIESNVDDNTPFPQNNMVPRIQNKLGDNTNQSNLSNIVSANIQQSVSNNNNISNTISNNPAISKDISPGSTTTTITTTTTTTDITHK